MPLRPEGSTISVGGYSLFVDDIKESYVIEPFEREEFKHQRQRTVLENTGVAPIIITKFAGGLAQLSYTCASTTLRPITPDDTDLNNIYRRWEILRYTVAGAPSTTTNVTGVYLIAQTHIKYLAELNAHFAFAKGDVSIQELTALQTDPIFGTITGTGLTMSGNAIGGSIDNMLITQFTIDFAYEIPLNSADSASQLFWSYSMVIENRVNNALDA